MKRAKIALGIYEKAFPPEISLSEKLCLSKNAGYDFFALSIDRTEEKRARLSSPDFLIELKNAEKKSGIPVSEICLSALSTFTLGNTDEKICKKGCALLFSAIDFAQKSGTRIIQIPACAVPKNQTLSSVHHELFLNNLKAAIEYASTKAVIIALENMEDDYSGTISKCTKIIETIASPYVCLYPDVGNLTNAVNARLSDIASEFSGGGGQKYSMCAFERSKASKIRRTFLRRRHCQFSILHKASP